MKADSPLSPEDMKHVLDGTRDLWPEMKDCRVLVTGATGFFGRWIMESLLAADARHALNLRVVALSRNPGAFLGRVPHLGDPRVTWLTGSVVDLVPGALGGGRVDAVIHLATEADLQASAANAGAAAAVITEGTRRALEVAAHCQARRFLFASSGAVYGRQPAGLPLIPESHPGRPDPSDGSPYGPSGEAKRKAELLCSARAAQDGLGAVIARCFTFAGPALPLDGKFAFGNFMGDALDGVAVRVKGDGSPVRSYLYAADLAVWLWTLLLQGDPGRAYNVGSEQPLTLLELAERIAGELGGKGVEVLGKPVPGKAPDRYLPSTLRARTELGLKEYFHLSEMIRRTAAWHRPPVKR